MAADHFWVRSDGSGGSTNFWSKVEASTGSVIWTYDHGRSINNFSGAGPDGTSYFSSSQDDQFVQVGPDGVADWSFDFSSSHLFVDTARVLPSGNPVAIAQPNTAGARRLTEFESADGSVVQSAIPSTGFRRLRFGQDGHLYVTDGVKIHKYDTTLGLVWEWTDPNGSAYNSGVTPNGTVYVVSNADVVYCISSSGVLQWTDTFDASPRMAVGDENHIYLCWYTGSEYRVGRFEDTGSGLSSSVWEIAYPGSVWDLQANGNDIYVDREHDDQNESQIDHVAPDGSPQLYFHNPGSIYGSRLAVQPDPVSVNEAPTATFAYSINGLTVDFTDQSADADGTIQSWSWDFGDGTTSTAQNPIHTYDADGTYTVSLEVTDDGGAKATASATPTVAAPTPASVTITTATTSATSGSLLAQATPRMAAISQASVTVHSGSLVTAASPRTSLFGMAWAPTSAISLTISRSTTSRSLIGATASAASTSLIVSHATSVRNIDSAMAPVGAGSFSIGQGELRGISTASVSLSAAAMSAAQVAAVFPFASAVAPTTATVFTVKSSELTAPSSSHVKGFTWPGLFSNARVRIKRTEGTRGPGGFSSESAPLILEAPCDFQSSTRLLERLRSLHETADGAVFVDGAAKARPGDDVELARADGRVLEGTVEAVDELSEMLVISTA
jgi:PKD repeat protein